MSTEPSEFPLLPYAGSSGWSGSEASRERAEYEDSTRITSKRQRLALALVREAGHEGLTWKELSERTGWHHGQATAPLSVLHQKGFLDRLTLKRGRCSVYVTPEFTGARETAQHRPNAARHEDDLQTTQGRYQAELALLKRQVTLLTSERTRLQAEVAGAQQRVNRALRGALEVVKVGQNSRHSFGSHQPRGCVMCLCWEILQTEKVEVKNASADQARRG